MSAEIALGPTLEIEAVIGATVIITDDNAVTDQDGTAVEMTGATLAAKLKERPTDADADAIGNITVVESANVLTYTLDNTLTALLEDGHDYHCVVTATMPADHVVVAYRSEPFAVRRIIVRARAV
jgi:hypothetical protein